MIEIRVLNSKDMPAIEAVIDSRVQFQEVGVDGGWTQRLKDIIIRNRIDRMGVWFIGYFKDSVLIALRECHDMRGPNTIFAGNAAMGISYTMAGNAVAKQRWRDSQWPHVLMELNEFAVNLLTKIGFTTIYVMGPSDEPKNGRLIDAPGSSLANPILWTREDVVTIPSGQRTGDPLIDDFVLIGATMNTDQKIFRFSKTNMAPMGQAGTSAVMPPRGDPSKVPTQHPPRK